MNHQAHNQGPPVTNQTQQPQQQQQAAAPLEVKAKVQLWPILLTTVFTTGAAVVTTIFITRHLEKRKEEETLRREREKEEAAALNPPMPMMWPGMQISGQQAANPSPAIDERLQDRLAEVEARETRATQREQVTDARDQQFIHLISPDSGMEGTGS